jgi:hypothetical protein
VTRKRPRATTQLVLECGHTVDGQYPWPAEMYCRACRALRPVARVGDNWRVTCSNKGAPRSGGSGGCHSFARSYGADRTRAVHVASLHVVKYPGHTVVIWNGETMVDTVRNEGQMLPVTMERLQLSREIQRTLREGVANIHQKKVAKSLDTESPLCDDSQ